MDELRDSVQQKCDSEGDGWQVTGYVTAVACQRLNADGDVESAIFAYSPIEQPSWISRAILAEAVDQV